MSSLFYCLACGHETVHRLCHKRVLNVGIWMHFPSQQQYLTRRRMTRPVRQATCRACETTWAHLTAWPTSWENVRKQTTSSSNDDDAVDMKDAADADAVLCKYTEAFRD